MGKGGGDAWAMHVTVRGEQLKASHKTSMAGAPRRDDGGNGEGGTTGKTSTSTFQPPCGRASESEKRRLCDANGKSARGIRVGDYSQCGNGGDKDGGGREARA
jgi:hypothetical protein